MWSLPLLVVVGGVMVIEGMRWSGSEGIEAMEKISEIITAVQAIAEVRGQEGSW